jgi:hypothetical protein
MDATRNEAERMNGRAPKRILIIAEISAARLRYAAVLKHEGFDVTAAANSSEAPWSLPSDYRWVQGGTAGPGMAIRVVESENAVYDVS